MNTALLQEDSLEILQRIFEASSDAIIIVDEKFSLLYANKRAINMLDNPISKLEGEHISNIIEIHKDEVQIDIQSTIKSSNNSDRIENLVLNNMMGKTYYVNLDYSHIDHNHPTNKKSILSLEDMTTQRKLEVKVARSKKLAELGFFCRGISHELTNPLSSILVGIKNISRRLDPNFVKNIEEAEHLGLDMELLNQYLQARNMQLFIDGITSSSERIKNMIISLLQFSSQHFGDKHQVNIIPIIDDAVIAVQRNKSELYAGVNLPKIIKNCTAVKVMVNCCEVEIREAFVYVISNAFDATVNNKHRQINIDIENQLDCIKVTIGDNGVGMSKTQLAKAFDPFFTSSNDKDNIGMGLPLAYKIIETIHHGHMYIHSNPDIGTQVVMELPID